ncbi:MAG TPA: hypothetical protein VFY68_03585, partial [Nitrososphaeraceae archaeon]|nr:hypothetical protein [Nitrososphaeraceae archaeon]
GNYGAAFLNSNAIKNLSCKLTTIDESDTAASSAMVIYMFYTQKIKLTCSFPYVRDWLNKHPFRNESSARLICNIMTGAPVNPEAMWTMMKDLRSRIYLMLEDGSVINDDERQKLQFLLKTKKWNPYCIRHSSITSDSDYLTEYALKKKVRWS